MVLTTTHHFSSKTFSAPAHWQGKQWTPPRDSGRKLLGAFRQLTLLTRPRLLNQLQLCADFLCDASPGPEYVLAAERFASFVISYNILKRPTGSPFAFAGPTAPQIVIEGPKDIQPRTPLRPGVPLLPPATMSYVLPPAPHRTSHDNKETYVYYVPRRNCASHTLLADTSGNNLHKLNDLIQHGGYNTFEVIRHLLATTHEDAAWTPQPFFHS